jgi:hypothetical protein
MSIDTLTGKNWQFPLRIVYLKHDFIQLYFIFRQIFSKFIYRAIRCVRAPKGSVVNFTVYKNFIELI